MTERDAGTTAALREQLDYYRARADGIDEWWLRDGLHERDRASWLADVATVVDALERFRPRGRVLELAGGTGTWSERLLGYADELTVVDGAPEMLALNAARLQSAPVRYVQADLFDWAPAERADTVFFSFWLSHVPPERFTAFWRLVDDCLAPGGRVFFVDSRPEETSTAVDHASAQHGAPLVERRVKDGRRFHVYKIFYEALALTEQLRALGWRFDVRESSRYFIHGAGERER
jgi:SAM-dependent methyltransferase